MKKQKVHVVNHPVIQQKLTLLRDRRTTPAHFRHTMEEIAQYLAYEVSRDFRTKTWTVDTPLMKAHGKTIADPVILVAIMRAGNGMLDGMLNVLPFAGVGHIGIYRDKFIKNTVEYYFRMPDDAAGKRILLLDPLLATGDTVVAAIERLKQYRVGPIRLVTVLAAVPGLKRLAKVHPDVEVFTLSVEKKLNAKGYILPGLGDAGDRLFNTVHGHA